MSPSDLTDEAVAAIDDRANAATAGPWEAPDQLLIPCVRGVSNHGNTIRVCQFGWNNSPDAKRRDAHNAAFIAHAREDVPALVAEVRRLRNEVSRLTLDSVLAERDALRAEAASAQVSYAILRTILTQGYIDATGDAKVAADVPLIDLARAVCDSLGTLRAERDAEAAGRDDLVRRLNLATETARQSDRSLYAIRNALDGAVTPPPGDSLARQVYETAQLAADFRRDLDEARAKLAALIAHENTRGHAHELCGVWDDRAKDGSRRLCARCHIYADARSMIGLPRWSTEGYDRLIARDAEGTEDCAHADDCGCGGKRWGVP